MKFLAFALIFSHTVFASSAHITTQEFQLHLEKNTQILEDLVHEEIGNENTCLDEYIQREKQLKKWLIWTPALSIAAVPAATLGGVAAGAALMNAMGVTGWETISYTIGGGMLGFGASVLGFVTVEAVSGVRFYKNRKFIHLIAESNSNNFEGKNVNKYLQKYHRAYPQDSMDIETFTGAISSLDSSGQLCDGSLRNNQEASKLKHKLAGKKDLFQAIHAQYGQEPIF